MPVSLAVFDAAGRRLKMLEQGMASAGRHLAAWDLSGEDGHRVAPGIYLVELQSGALVDTRRIAVLP